MRKRGLSVHKDAMLVIGIILGLTFFLSSVCLIISAIGIQRMDTQFIQRGQRTSGRIVNIGVERVMRRTNIFRVEYEYQHEGRWFFGAQDLPIDTPILALASESEIDVVYLPGKPQCSRLVSYRPFIGWRYELGIPLLISSLVILAFLIRSSLS
jgi:hypothetical protein